MQDFLYTPERHHGSNTLFQRASVEVLESEILSSTASQNETFRGETCDKLPQDREFWAPGMGTQAGCRFMHRETSYGEG